jgi:hypothetical protein
VLERHLSDKTLPQIVSPKYSENRAISSLTSKMFSPQHNRNFGATSVFSFNGPSKTPSNLKNYKSPVTGYDTAFNSPKKTPMQL